MSNDETLSNKAMDAAVEGVMAQEREIADANIRRARQPRIDRVQAGLRKYCPLAGPRLPHVSEADAALARTLLNQIYDAPTDAALAAAEGFLANLGALPGQG